MSAPPERLGKYLIRREIGKGSMGVVYEAFDPVIERRVAVKMIRPDDFGTVQGADLVVRLKREAQAAGRLNHPGIVAIHDFGEGDGAAFIAMEYVEGRELRDLLDAGRRFTPRESVRIVGAALAALQHAHERGVTHRDIKPANVILLPDGAVKIADFGVARIEHSELTQAGTIIGTPMYMSPEQILGLPVDGRSDLFSCGVLLYELLTGTKPFVGSVATVIRQVLDVDPPPPSRADATLGPRWDALMRQALAKKPEHRFGSAREMAVALERTVNAIDDDDADATIARPAAVRHAPPVRPDATMARGSAGAAGSPPRRSVRALSIAAGTVAATGALILAWRFASTPAVQPAPALTAAPAAASAPAGSGASTLPVVAVAAQDAARSTDAPTPVAAPTPLPSPPAPPAPTMPADHGSRMAVAPRAASAPSAKPAPVETPRPAKAELKPAPSPASAPVPAPNEWAARLDPARLEAAPVPTTLSAAARRILDPVDAGDAARLIEFDAQLARQEPPFAYAIGVSQGRLVHAWSTGADAAAAAAAARRRCSEIQAQGCMTVYVDGLLRRRAFFDVARGLGAQPPRAVRSAWMQSVTDATRDLRTAVAAAPSPPAASAPAPAPAPAPVPRPAAQPPAASAVAPQENEWSKARSRLRDAQPGTLAAALALLLDAETPADRERLDRLQTAVKRLRWKSALAVGVNASGHLVWRFVEAQPRNEWAEDRVMQLCSPNVKDGCVVVAANGDFRPAALVTVAGRFGARPQAEVRDAFLRSVDKQFR
jgi:predicted Ser/Thr protein kinase